MKAVSILAILWWTVRLCFSLACPRECRCDKGRKIVFCNERGLKYVPYGIPTNTRVLHLQGNVIVNSPTSEENLRRLSSLRKLDLHGNKLTSFPKKLPSSLEYISLQRNHLKYVGRDVLSGLTRLTELHLDGNNITSAGISRSAFKNALSLQVLVMTGNLLTSLPLNLPPSIRFLRLDKNRIDVVSSSAAKTLTSLSAIDLSHNRINTGLDEGAFSQLSSLRSLNLQANLLHSVPKYLPTGLNELLLAKNKIKFIRSDATALNSLSGLKKLDLSSNQIESVQVSAFDGLINLRSVELHDNPWRCDCYLLYLKSWSSETAAIIGSQGNVRCYSPGAFQGVTLGSIDVETLSEQCAETSGNAISRQNIGTSILGFGFSGFKAHDPDYLTYIAIYGKLLCSNCTVDTMNPLTKAVEVLEVTATKPVNSTKNQLSNLDPDTRYVICVYTSYTSANDVTVTSCQEFRTAVNPVKENETVRRKSLPSWLVVTMSAVLFSTVVVIIMLIVWKVYTSRSTVTKSSYVTSHERYLPPQYVQPDVTYPTTGNGVEIHTYSGNDVKRCCAGLSASTTTLDARPEFDVALLVRTHNTVRPNSHSDTDVASTTQTGITEANGSIDSLTYAAATLPRRPTSQIYSHFHCDVTPRHNDSRYSWFGSPSTDLDDTGVYV
ncbi:uncharacterized protein LOC100183310 [Ciona intestinalis]